jgi:hypothetical protein
LLCVRDLKNRQNWDHQSSEGNKQRYGTLGTDPKIDRGDAMGGEVSVLSSISNFVGSAEETLRGSNAGSRPSRGTNWEDLSSDDLIRGGRDGGGLDLMPDRCSGCATGVAVAGLVGCDVFFSKIK